MTDHQRSRSDLSRFLYVDKRGHNLIILLNIIFILVDLVVVITVITGSNCLLFDQVVTFKQHIVLRRYRWEASIGIRAGSTATGDKRRRRG